MPTMRKSGISLLLTALWLCASTAQGAAQTYNLTDLGTLSGNKVAKAYALNHAGQAAGTSSGPTAAIAVMFSGGKVSSINTLAADVSVATAMNGSGEVAGYNIFYSKPNAEFQAFLYSNGSMTNINSASLFPGGSAAWGMNNSGQAVGTGYLSGANFHAFLYSGGKMIDLGPSGAYQASAAAINTSGEIIGSYYLTSGAAGAFVYSNGKMTTLPVPTGSSAVSAFALNDYGEIAGSIYPSSGAAAHAASFSNGIWTDLGVIAGAQASTAKGINITGQIVGTEEASSLHLHWERVSGSQYADCVRLRLHAYGRRCHQRRGPDSLRCH